MSKKGFESYDNFRKGLIYWYQSNKRELPWRETRDPYQIWLSEIILQQTRVDQGMAYYLKFVEHYPTVFDLANASEEKVLRDWQGLGYYSRARNLHYSAKMIVSELGGQFPDSFEEIKKLKGVGDYTAAAIASFSYDLPHAVLDGNVFRVLSRVFGVTDDISASPSKKVFQNLADDALYKDDPAIYNQSIMEFGALQCVPKTPNCEACFLNSECVAYSTNKVAELPVKLKKTKVRNRFFNYLVIKSDSNELVLVLRKEGDIWQGLYELPLIETECASDSEEVIKALGGNGVSIKLMAEAKHILSHQRIFSRFWYVDIVDSAGFQFYKKEEVEELPKSVLVNKFLTEFYF